MPNATLRALLRAIASGDDAKSAQLLAASPALASQAVASGAKRERSEEHFLTEIERQVYTGDTALHIAAAAYRVDIARKLVSLGANPTARNRLGAEPLHYASVGGPGSRHWNPEAQAACIEYLIGAGANANAADKMGVTPLHRAVRTRCAAAVHALLAHGADARRQNKRGSTPLHLVGINSGRGGSGSAEAKQQQKEIARQLTSYSETENR